MQRHLAQLNALTARSRPSALGWVLLALLALAAAPAAWAQVQLPAPPSSPAPVQRLEYDPNGNLTRHMQQQAAAGSGLATQHQYDKLNRATLTVDARAGLTRRTYSASDDLTALTDPINAQTLYGRNGLGQVVLQSSPDTGNSSQTYNAAGQLLTRTDARGVVSTHTYDALGRLTRLEHAGQGFATQAFNFNFDEVVNGSTSGIGQLTSISGPASYAQYSYDAAGRVVQRLQRTPLDPAAGGAAFVSHLTAYTYDDGGNITSITLPSGRVVIYTRSAGVAQAISVAANAGAAATPLMSQIQWLPFGAPGAWLWHTSAGTRAHNRTFDSTGRVVRYTLGTSVRDLRYDATDRIISYTHYDALTGAPTPALDQQFGYDELNRLTTAVISTQATSIGFDANGNRTSISIGGVSGQYVTLGQSNRMVLAPFPQRTITYDAAGNPGSANFRASATYDAAGHQATSTTTRWTTRYSYDAFGRRVKKSSDWWRLLLQSPTVPYGQTALYPGQNGTDAGFIRIPVAYNTIYIYDDDHHLLGEYDGVTGDPIREYIWLQDIPIAMLRANPNNPQGPPQTYLIHADHLNAPRVLLDQDYVMRWRWMDDPFGSGVAEEDPNEDGQVVVFSLRFPGQIYDAESSLHYNINRYYDPRDGRYTQSDPIGLAGGINTYAYVGGNPISNVDPEGLQGIQPAPMLRPTPQIPGAGGQFPYIRPEWNYPGLPEPRELTRVCVRPSCPIPQPDACTASNPSGAPALWSQGPFATAPGQSLPGCVCLEYGWDVARNPYPFVLPPPSFSQNS